MDGVKCSEVRLVMATRGGGLSWTQIFLNVLHLPLQKSSSAHSILFSPLHNIMSTARFDLAAFPTSETIKMLTNILVKITRTNDRLCSTAESDKDRPNAHSPLYTCFHARSIPTIDIHSYLSRILKYTPCANEVC